MLSSAAASLKSRLAELEAARSPEELKWEIDCRLHRWCATRYKPALMKLRRSGTADEKAAAAALLDYGKSDMPEQGIGVLTTPSLRMLKKLIQESVAKRSHESAGTS